VQRFFCDRCGKSYSEIQPLDGLFTYLALANDSKLIINWLVGKRTRENAMEFMTELKRRVTGDFQLATDGWKIYSGRTGTVATVFGHSINYGTETKFFAKPQLWYMPRKLIGLRRHRVSGNPDIKMNTICHAERTNLSLRTFTRRLTRCTLGYSKKLENLRHSIALFVWHYNFCRVHSAHGKTPAQAAGLTDRVWTIKELLS
jgi:IS1 family transposase